MNKPELITADGTKTAIFNGLFFFKIIQKIGDMLSYSVQLSAKRAVLTKVERKTSFEFIFRLSLFRQHSNL